MACRFPVLCIDTLIGVLGGYMMFSTFEMETPLLAEPGEPGKPRSENAMALLA